MSDSRLTNHLEILGTCVRRLGEVVAEPPEDIRDLAGIVKHFELAFEQSHQCLMEILIASGEEDAKRSLKIVFRRAFEFGWIRDEPSFASMIRDRNATSHTYDAEFAAAMVDRITNLYLPLFQQLHATLLVEQANLNL